MNKTCFALLIAVIALASFANAMPATIDRVLVNGNAVDPDTENMLSAEIGDVLEVKVQVTALSDLKDAEVEAYITGYEYNDKEKVSDVSHAFDMEENTTYVKKIYLTLPERMDEDAYKLRIIVSDRNNDETSANYNLKIDAVRHSIIIRDVMVSPEYGAEAGSYALASVRVKNIGQKDEDSVKVSFSIPDLGVSQSVYIDEVEAGDSETSEEAFLAIPECTEPGEYPVIAKVTYDEGYEVLQDYASITVNGGTCEADEEDKEEEEDEEGEDAGFVLPPAITQPQQPADESSARLRNALEISLVALIIILVILGLIIGFSKLNSDEEMY